MVVLKLHRGSGKATKSELRSEVKKTLSDVERDLNISDAAALALYSRDLSNLITNDVLPESVYKRKLIKELTQPSVVDIPKKKRMLYLKDSVLPKYRWASRLSISGEAL